MSLVASFKTKDGKYYNSKETFLGLDDLDEIRKKAKEEAMRRILK